MAIERLATNLHNLARDVSFVSGKVSPDSFLSRRPTESSLDLPLKSPLSFRIPNSFHLPPSPTQKRTLNIASLQEDSTELLSF